MEPEGRTLTGRIFAALRWPVVAPIYYALFKMTPRFWPYVTGINPVAEHEKQP